MKVFVGLILVGVVLAGIMFWRLSSGPVSLAYLKDPLENILNNSLETVEIKISDAVVEQTASGSVFQFRLKDLRVLGTGGEVLARAPRAAIGISSLALLKGDIVPSRLELIGPRIRLSRDKDGSISLGFSDQESVEQSQDETPVSARQIVDKVLEIFTAPANSGSAASYFNHVRVSEAAVSLYDDNNNALWFAPNTEFEFRRAEDGVVLDGSVNVSGKTPWQVTLNADYVKSRNTFRLNSKISHFIPAQIAGKLSVLSDFAQVALPMTGEASLEVDRSGKTLSATARLDAGAGTVGIPELITEPLNVTSGEVNLVYDPENTVVRFVDTNLIVEENKTSLAGFFKPNWSENSLDSLGFELEAKTIGLEGADQDARIVDTVTLKGAADLAARRVDIGQFRIAAKDSEIALQGSVQDGERAPAIRMQGGMKNVPFSLLMKLWPKQAADGARDWLAENIIEGDITTASIKVDLSETDLVNAKNDLPIPNENIDMVFDFENIVSRYLGELPVIRGGVGRGRLRGDDFTLDVKSGHVLVGKKKEKLVITKGRFTIPELSPKGPMSHVSASIKGETRNVLHVLDHKPLGYMKKFGLDPDTVSGKATVNLAMDIPLLKKLPLERVGLKAKASIDGLKLPNVFSSADIDGGKLNLDVTKESLKGRGNITLNGVPAKLTWLENFESQGKDSSRFELTAKISDKQRRRLGIDLSDIMSGATTVKVVATGSGPEIRKAHVSANLSSAKLFFEPIGWYRSGTKGDKADMDLTFKPGIIEFKNLKVKGAHLSMKGSLTINESGRILSLNLPQVSLGRSSKMSLKGKRDKNKALALTLAAPKFDVRPLLRKTLRSSGGRSSGSSKKRAGGGANVIRVTGKVGTAYAFNGETAHNIKLSVVSRNETIQNMQIDGTLADNRPFKARIGANDTGKRQMRIDAGNAGRILRAANLYSKIDGGDFRLKLSLAPVGSAGVRVGELKLKRFSVRNEDALKDFQNAKRDTQLGRARKDNDFEFDSLKIPFRTKGNIMQIENALLKGAAIGASAQGTIDTRKDRINIGGTLIPAYALNSIVSHVPLIGDILTGGKGQGVFGVTFAVQGNVDSPRVKINPVSALAPGILRKVFEFGSDDKIGTPKKKRRSKPVSDR